MKHLLLSTAFVMSASVTLAAGYDPVPPAPTPAPVIVEPAAPAITWSGFYVGGQIGAGQFGVEDADDDDQEDFDMAGLHAGYMRDLGRFVLGGELDIDAVEFDDDFIDSDEIDTSIARLKLRGGYDLGRFLPYVTVGAARAMFDGDVEEEIDGAVYGLGAAYKATDSFIISAEYLRHNFEDVDTFPATGGETDFEADTISLRASYQF